MKVLDTMRFPFVLVGALVAMVALSCSAGFRIRTVEIEKVNYVLLQDVAAFYAMVYDPDEDGARLFSRYSTLVFRQNRREASINNVSVHLSFAIAKSKSHFVISETDFRRTLEPILRLTVIPDGDIRIIVLDPGHGGGDPGASGALYKEKDINLQLAKKLAVYLRRYGYKVLLTRDGDQKLQLSDRTAYARKVKADLFVSLHANFTSTTSVSGIETFVLTHQNAPPTYGTAVQDKAQPGNSYDLQNARLAFETQKRLISATGADDRGVKRATFAVLRDAPCPAMLVEVGFMSNAAEEKKLGNAQYQAKIVQGLGEGILKYADDLKRKPRR